MKKYLMHFGAGNIFRIFPARLIDELNKIDDTKTDIIAVEGFDYEIIDKVFKPYNNETLGVILKSDKTIDIKKINSIKKALKLDDISSNDFKEILRLVEDKNLQIMSFTITEKGYKIKDNNNIFFNSIKEDIDNNLSNPKSYLGKVIYLLYQRYKKINHPISLLSLDNLSHNGDVLKKAILDISIELFKNNSIEEEFINYLNNKVTYPVSMIDKITPRPDESIIPLLKEKGYDPKIEITSKNTYVSYFVNAEESEYLVIEDNFINGRPNLDKVGVYFTDKETVNKVEKMKVGTCLNPLHTTLSILGMLLDYKYIYQMMDNKYITNFLKEISYNEGLKVVVDPLIINPKDFLNEVLTKRLNNPFIPDTPNRIVTDTSQKIPVRFMETIKLYKEKNLDLKDLNYIPLVIALWLRYLLGINDKGEKINLSPDPLLDLLTNKLANIKLGDTNFNIKDILNIKEIFLIDLYEIGIASKIESYFKELIKGENAVENTLKKYFS